MKRILYRLVKASLVFLVPLILYSNASEAHPGAVDRYGGHWDHKRNIYHCHRDGCVPPTCSPRPSDYRCGNEYYGSGNYAPGGRNDPKRYR